MWILILTFSLYFTCFLISEPISKAKTLINYNSVDAGLMSFRQNADAIVFMKSAGTHSDLWYATIDGKSGFAPSKFLKEMKILEKSPLVIVPLEVRQKESQVPDVHPDKVQLAHEVIEGTTIYTTEASPVQDSTTENPETPPNDFTTPTLDTHEESAKSSEEIQSDSLNPNSGNSDSTVKVSTSSDTSQTDSVTKGQNLNSDASTETIPPETVDNKAETKQNVVQTNQVLPNHLADALSPHDHDTSSSETFEVLDLNYVQNTLNEPENVDSNELNTSLPNSNAVENNIVTESSSETSVVSDNHNQFQAKETENNNANDNTVNQDINTQNINGIKLENIISEKNIFLEKILNENIKQGETFDTQNEQKTENASEDTVMKSQNESMIDDEEVRRNENEQIKENLKGDTKFETQSDQVNVIEDAVIKSQNESIIENSKEEATGITKNTEQIKENAKGDTTFETPNEQVIAIEDTVLEAQNELIIENSKEEVTGTIKDSEELKRDANDNIVAVEGLLLNRYSKVEARTTQEEPAIPPQHNEETKTESAQELPNIPSEPPSKLTDTIPPANIAEALIPTSSELPPVQQTNPTTDTLKPVFTYPENLNLPDPSVTPDPNIYNYYSQEPVKDAISDNIKVNEPLPENVDEYTTVLPTAESVNDNPTDEIYASTEAPPPQDDNAESFLSSMYSTLVDIWPSTTEAPPSLFNEEYTKFEEKESSDGFSLMSYLMSIYYSVMGPSDDIKALFPSHGKCI